MASKGTRCKEEHILHILKEVEAGTSVAEQTVYRWRSKHGDLKSSGLQRLREL